MINLPSDKNQRAWYLKAKVKVLYIDSYQMDYEAVIPEPEVEPQFLESPEFVGGFPGGSEGKESSCKAGDLGSVPGWGRFPGEEKGNPLQYSFFFLIN